MEALGWSSGTELCDGALGWSSGMELCDGALGWSSGMELCDGALLQPPSSERFEACGGVGSVALRRSVMSEDDGDAVGVEDHAGGGFVGAGQVVEVLAVGVAPRVGHLLVLLHADHQALVADRLHVVLIAVGRLVEGALRGDTGGVTRVTIDTGRGHTRDHRHGAGSHA
ncbi:hypothetical protein EYF80_056303 [Liparis tanakae]|uniref:Uncharacterized protein n=1 Tax=Liparis tanakae TaxID=230148 RepID=A0A4Z2EYU2_9TELE|nr:hypothetical protein EYF80_056303 [Liparis tanakae]